MAQNSRSNKQRIARGTSYTLIHCGVQYSGKRTRTIAAWCSPTLLFCVITLSADSQGEPRQSLHTDDESGELNCMKRFSHFSKTAVALQVGTRPLQTEIAESHAGHTPIPFLKRTRSYIRTPFRMEHSSPSKKQLHVELLLSNSTLKAGRGEAYTPTHMRRSEAHATHAPHLATRSTLA